MKNRTRTVIELVIILVAAVWIAVMIQWQTRHPGERLGLGTERDALTVAKSKPAGKRTPE